MNGNSEWNCSLEDAANRIEAMVLAGQVRCSEDYLILNGPTPVFAAHGPCSLVVPVFLAGILRTWETDPDNGESDRELIRQMKRKDLPAGSFFVLIVPKGGPRYHCALHEPAKGKGKGK